MSDFFPLIFMAAMLFIVFVVQGRGKPGPPPARWKVVAAVLGALLVPVAVFAARFLMARP